MNEQGPDPINVGKPIGCAIVFCGCAAAAIYSNLHGLDYGWWIVGAVIAFLCV